MLALRPFQLNALQALRSDQHVVCVAPTGSGKSLIYERAILSDKRRVLLITPLIALARQQQRRLEKAGVRVRNGQKSDWPQTSGQYESWILSPEKLTHNSIQNDLRHWRPDLLVVDECHCIWEWGENFRPHFRKIPDLIKNLKLKRSLWLTATLPFSYRHELRSFLAPPLIELGEFSLPSTLRLEIHCVEWPRRLEALMSWITAQTGDGIVFCNTREATERISRLLQSVGLKSLAYHAGLSIEERLNTEQLIRNQNIQIVVATSAFGMGMDYPHLRWAALWQAPTSILALTQAIGRVGRSSEAPARAAVFWHSDDFKMLEWTLGSSARRRSELLAMLDFFQLKECRLKGLRQYFDRSIPKNNCEKCDICSPA